MRLKRYPISSKPLVKWIENIDGMRINALVGVTVTGEGNYACCTGFYCVHVYQDGSLWVNTKSKKL